MSPQPRRNLGWLGPAIVIVGAAVAGVGVWYMVHARPEAGAVVDRQSIDAQHALIVRAETTTGDQRAFVELREGERVLWQALIPHYAGHAGATGLTWSPTAVSVRVMRDGYAEVFALAMHDASKLGSIRLAPKHGKVIDEPGSPISLTDHQRSYEIVAGPDWHQLVALDLTSGKGLWSQELGAAPVRAAGVRGEQVWIDQGDGPRSFAVTSGDPVSAKNL
jgi:outer membrane protein assembly factor BamB